jgi:hypothetical protein
MDQVAIRGLLIEDNPGNARLVKENLAVAEDGTPRSCWTGRPASPPAR